MLLYRKNCQIGKSGFNFILITGLIGLTTQTWQQTITRKFLWKVCLVENVHQFVDDDEGAVEWARRRQDLTKLGSHGRHGKSSAWNFVLSGDPLHFRLEEKNERFSLLVTIDTLGSRYTDCPYNQTPKTMSCYTDWFLTDWPGYTDWLFMAVCITRSICLDGPIPQSTPVPPK